MDLPWYLGNSSDFFPYRFVTFLPLFIIWSMVWKGLALWHSAKRDEKWWFIAFMVVQTAGILEIIYLIFRVNLFSNSKSTHKRRH